MGRHKCSCGKKASKVINKDVNKGLGNVIGYIFDANCASNTVNSTGMHFQ